MERSKVGFGGGNKLNKFSKWETFNWLRVNYFPIKLLSIKRINGIVN